MPGGSFFRQPGAEAETLEPARHLFEARREQAFPVSRFRLRDEHGLQGGTFAGDFQVRIPLQTLVVMVPLGQTILFDRIRDVDLLGLPSKTSAPTRTATSTPFI